MATKRSRRAVKSVTVRLDLASLKLVSNAAKLRGVGLSDYVRMVAVAQASREVDSALGTTISLSAADQLAFWRALSKPTRLTSAQRELGELMRGKK